jgi:signal transduction histidine kinase/ActR/RegA family two-component response regulator
VQPLLDREVPYGVYIAAVVAATWYCGVDGGLLCAVLSVVVGHYFFAEPRFSLLPHGGEWVAAGIVFGLSLGMVWFVARSQRVEAALHAAHAQVRDVLEQVPVGVLVADTSGTILFGNSASQLILRSAVDQTKVTDVRYRSHYTPYRADGTVCEPGDAALMRALKGDTAVDEEYRLVWPDGTEKVVSAHAAPIRNVGGQVKGGVIALVDVTDQRAASERLRDANRLKDEFLATLSHELRTPLNAIVGWSDMLRRGNLTPADQQRANEAIYRNAKVQSELINDVLDVSRIISGKVRIETQPVDPVAVMQTALESVRPAATAKGLTIHTEWAALPFRLSGDATRLQQVFWNLLANAVKFTPPGGHVTAALRLVGRAVQVHVSDTGVGIPPAFLPYVFDRFRQRDSSTTRKHGGLGLGLAIVRHLVELHGGTVHAESAGEGKGATFTVTLPAVPYQERRRVDRSIAERVAAVEPVSDDAPSLRGLRVLVVDDERDAREVAASVLRHHGAEAVAAASGAEALQLFGAFQPDVLLVDLAMPGMDGYGVIQRIRSQNGEMGTRVPAIAFTAYAGEEDERRALASGFQLHLAKPVDSQTLVRAVARVHDGKGDRAA